MHAMKLFAKSARVRILKETRLKNMKLLVPFTRDSLGYLNYLYVFGEILTKVSIYIYIILQIPPKDLIR